MEPHDRLVVKKSQKTWTNRTNFSFRRPPFRRSVAWFFTILGRSSVRWPNLMPTMLDKLLLQMFETF